MGNIPEWFILIVTIFAIVWGILWAAIPFMVYAHRRDMKVLLRNQKRLIDAIVASKGDPHA